MQTYFSTRLLCSTTRLQNCLVNLFHFKKIIINNRKLEFFISFLMFTNIKKHTFKNSSRYILTKTKSLILLYFWWFIFCKLQCYKIIIVSSRPGRPVKRYLFHQTNNSQETQPNKSLHVSFRLVCIEIILIFLLC